MISMHEILSWENAYKVSAILGNLWGTWRNSGQLEALNEEHVLNLINVKLVEQEKIVFKNV